MSTPAPTTKPRSAKEETVDAWDARADRWDSWAAMVEDWFAPVTRALLDGVQLAPGDRVLELAAGSGGFTRALAQAVGDRGRVISTDSGPRMVALTARNLREFPQVTAQVMDGEAADPSVGPVDAVACRQGVMFFADPAESFRRLFPLLRPGGRIAVSAFTAPDRNRFMSLPSSILNRWAESGNPPAAPAPGPGPFSLADPDHLARLLVRAGFEEPRSVVLDCPLRAGSLAELLDFYHGILGATVQKLPAAQQAQAWAEVERACAPFVAPGGPGGPSEIYVVSARKGAGSSPADGPHKPARRSPRRSSVQK